MPVATGAMSSHFVGVQMQHKSPDIRVYLHFQLFKLPCILQADIPAEAPLE